MSFTGTGSFGNYDLTAQMTGSPLARQTTNDHQHEEAATTAGSSPARKDQGTRTRATSVTEVADGDVSRSEKDTTPGNATDTAAEDDEDEEDAIEQERRHSLVQALAKKYTNQSYAGAEAGVNPFSVASDDETSPLNPNGPNFNARAWAKAIVGMAAGEGHQLRTAGVAFQNLNVHGFGSATDYQKDVVNVWLEAVGLVRRVTGHGKRRIDILRNFDGVVRKGEMLVVLGPPGSGCTTFLKTIAGDYNGIFVDDDSYFNYQGESLGQIILLTHYVLHENQFVDS
jgi:ABC-type multidrug transport system fused ATPase/permease subunit